MKTKSVIGLFAGLLAVSSCTVQSIHPLYDEASTLYEPFLEGDWVDDEGNSWVIEKALKPDADALKKEQISSKAYQMTYHGDSVEARLDVFLVKLGGSYFIDLFPADSYDQQVGNDVLLGNLLPVHTFSKIEMKNDSLLVSQFDSEWLEDLIINNQIRISHEIVKAHKINRIVLTASTKELQKFVGKYHGDPKAFEEPNKFFRKR